jgi:hypothetical protein
MSIPDWIESIGRAVFESPFAGEDHSDTPEIAEVRLAILDTLRAKCQRVTGRQVFPYNLVHVLIRGVRDTDAGAVRSSFLRQMLEREIRSGLQKARTRFPDDLALEIDCSPELPASGDPWISVEVGNQARRAAGVTRRPARLVVLQGTANVAELVIDKVRINIGRTLDVQRATGPSRRNDLAFADDGPVNRTVSREHAHIRFSKKTGEHRLFNDRYYNGENCGLWIMRDGLSQPVHRDTRGTRLHPGDEIHFGSAVVKFVARQ